MKKVYLLLVVTIVAMFLFSLCACTPTKKTEDVTPTRTDFDVFFLNNSLDSQSSYEISVTDATKYTVKMADIEGIREGLLSVLDTISKDFYDSNGSIYTKMGPIELSTEERTGGYRIVVFTSVAKDQDDTNVAKIVRINNVTLKQVSKDVEEMSFEAGCTIFIAKIKIA